jgi:hypothetical protein
VRTVARSRRVSCTGGELPQFVKDEFDVFLKCGILAHGLNAWH